MSELVSAPNDVTVSATGPLRHLCPFVDEVDEGTVTITWKCYSETFELHELAKYLARWANVTISHEALVDTMRDDLVAGGLEVVHIAATFTTAGLSVTVTG